MLQLRRDSFSAFVYFFGHLVQQDRPFYSSKFPMLHAAAWNSVHSIRSTWTLKLGTSSVQSSCLPLKFLPVSISRTCPTVIFLRDTQRSCTFYRSSDLSLRSSCAYSSSIDDAGPRQCVLGPFIATLRPCDVLALFRSLNVPWDVSSRIDRRHVITMSSVQVQHGCITRVSCLKKILHLSQPNASLGEGIRRRSTSYVLVGRKSYDAACVAMMLH